MRNETEIAKQIRAKLIAERANNLSDETIDRCLRPTICGNRMASMAKKMRDDGELFAPAFDGSHQDNLTHRDECFLCGSVYYNCVCSHEA